MKLATIQLGDKSYTIVASYHAKKRMVQRKIDAYTVVGNILLLGKDRLDELQRTQEEFIIIDEDTDTSIVGVCKDDGVIVIITVINKSNVFVKSNTRIINL